jgi:hypothetical protein
MIPVVMRYMRMHKIFFSNDEITRILFNPTSIRSLHITQNAGRFQTAIVEQSGAPTYSILVVILVATRPSAPHQTRLPSTTGSSRCL